MKRIGRIFPALAAAVALSVISCAASRITSTYMDDAYSGGPMKTAMVVGIFDDLKMRKIFEDAFVQQLTPAGVAAVTSYAWFPTDKEIDTTAVKKVARQKGIDRVLVTRLIGVEEKEVYNPPVTSPIPHPYYYSYGQYYSTVYHYVNTPGYTTTHEYVRLESNLYAVDSEKLVWSAATETIDPEDVGKAADTLCKVLVKNLKINGLVE